MPSDLLAAFMIFIIESLALRWLIFDYKKLKFLRDFLLRGFLAELNFCVFCQGIEAGLAVYLSHFRISNIDVFLWPLAAGFIALVSQNLINSQIESLEEQIHFSFTETEKDVDKLG